ncbi:uncharacterized protein M6B38_129455 [Iris pallida]|uniref:J domain-containing protein n=1 Tax=Iris pallida TaxID=29817 RepID=A0AAX6G5K9_IRIPA|nr:uncharacterized protein M6B38_129450 [Iris pallida]KAJ6824037.1 uncharacterized protein M6B38_129455 [Iris pallida]
MAPGAEKGGDFYGVLGLKKECSEAELKNAYKKLAMRWHPDRCSASGSIEEAKEKFQAIQEAYSVLSDSNKRFLYDAGVYDSDDDENSFGDFLGEMAQMMSQTKPTENGSHETFEELQQLFVDLFQDDPDRGFGGPTSLYASNDSGQFSGSASSGLPYCNGINGSNKRGNATMNSGKTELDDFLSVSGDFCFGLSDLGQSSGGHGGSRSKRRNGR